MRARAKFANIAKVSSTRKIGVIQYVGHSTRIVIVVSTSYLVHFETL